jgi:hypothetical protein
MGVQLRQHVGRELFKQGETAQNFDEILCDGLILGMSFRFENKIHWRYKKKEIPKSIRKQAIRLCQDRNAKRP